MAGVFSSSSSRPLPHDQRVAIMELEGLPVPKGETGEKFNDP